MKPYDPPPPAAQDAERPPEVIEAEMKALEEAMEALALITLKLVSTLDFLFLVMKKKTAECPSSNYSIVCGFQDSRNSFMVRTTAGGALGTRQKDMVN